MKAGHIFALLSITFQIISSLLSPTQADCPLSFSKYQYQPAGECLHKAEKIKELNSITTNRCCRNALNALTQNLAVRAKAKPNGSLFVPQDDLLNCSFTVPEEDSIPLKSCGLSDLYERNDECSKLTLHDLKTNLSERYDSVTKNCSQIVSHSFNESCRRCVNDIAGAEEVLKEQMQLKDKKGADICAVAIVVAVAASNIENDTWVEDFYRCLPALDRPVRGYFKIKASLAKIIMAVLIAVAGMVLAIVLIKYVNRKKKPFKPIQGKGVSAWSGLYIFSREEIEKAMSYSNRKESLGAGSAGRVYKGMLPSGQLVAIKHIYKSTNSDSFMREVRGLSRIRHPNLVFLFGCCIDGPDQFLVYEYCPYGNLAHHLLRSDSVLSWNTRVKILRDCALALRFLHTYPDGCIVHRDIKLTNILLTENMEPKLSDFGLARMLNMKESKVFTDVRGTIGYMDPEYMTNAKLTCASDVYSFGIVALQVLSGRRVIELDLDGRDHLTRKGKDVSMGKRPLSDFVDPKLNGQLNLEDFRMILHVAVLCVAKSSKGRPPVSEVFDELDKVWKNAADNLLNQAGTDAEV